MVLSLIYAVRSNYRVNCIQAENLSCAWIPTMDLVWCCGVSSGKIEDERLGARVNFIGSVSTRVTIQSSLIQPKSN